MTCVKFILYFTLNKKMTFLLYRGKKHLVTNQYMRIFCLLCWWCLSTSHSNPCLHKCRGAPLDMNIYNPLHRASRVITNSSREPSKPSFCSLKHLWVDISSLRELNQVSSQWLPENTGHQQVDCYDGRLSVTLSLMCRGREHSHPALNPTLVT